LTAWLLSQQQDDERQQDDEKQKMVSRDVSIVHRMIAADLSIMFPEA
jgi:hypothetical protein